MFGNKPDKKMTYGIVGLGRFGFALANELAASGAELIVLDQNEDKVSEMREVTENAYVVKCLDKKTLEESGIQNCDVAVVCIGEQMDTSILTTLNLVSLGMPKVLAKATSIEHGIILEKLGAEVVYPERDMAIRLGKGLVYHSFLDSVALEGNVEVRRIQVTEPLIGLTVRETDFRQKYGLNIIAIEHNHHTDVEFSSSYQFKAGDIISVIGQTGNIERFESDMQ